MNDRKLSYAEKLVKELADLRKGKSEYESWRWQASVNFYEPGVITTTVTEKSFLCFKSCDEKTAFRKMPYAVAKEFHSFLAQKRNDAHRRIGEIEQELEELK